MHDKDGLLRLLAAMAHEETSDPQHSSLYSDLFRQDSEIQWELADELVFAERTYEVVRKDLQSS